MRAQRSIRDDGAQRARAASVRLRRTSSCIRAKRTPRDPVRQATWTVPPGTTIYFGGQIFETAPLSRPATVWLVQFFAPLTLMMSAAVLFYQFVTFALAAGGESAGGNAVRQGMLRALVWAPAFGVALIVATASIGCWYQLRLATSARLVGKADFLNAFLAYNAIGLAVAAFLAGCMRPTRLDLNRGLQWSLLSIGLGGAALFWLEPLTQWLANAPADRAAPAAAAGSLPRLGPAAQSRFFCGPSSGGSHAPAVNSIGHPIRERLPIASRRGSVDGATKRFASACAGSKSALPVR